MEAPYELHLVDVRSGGLANRHPIDRPPLARRGEHRIDVGTDESEEREFRRQDIGLTRQDGHTGREIVAHLQRARLRQSLTVRPQWRESDPGAPHHPIKIVPVEHPVYDDAGNSGAAIALPFRQTSNHIHPNPGPLTLKGIKKIL